MWRRYQHQISKKKKLEKMCCRPDFWWKKCDAGKNSPEFPRKLLSLCANLRYRACILYLVIRPTCGLIVWSAWTSSPSAHALCNFLVDLLPCRFHSPRPPTSRVVARVCSLPSPSLCWRTLETDTSFTCSLCASARSPCKHSRITACSKKFRSFMFDYHFTCAKLQYSHAL